MKMQHYKVLGFGTSTTDVTPAQFIYSDDSRSEILGFTHRCNEESTDVVLFDVVDINSPRAVMLNKQLSWDDVLEMLTEALRANPSMFPHWAQEFDLPDIL